MATYTATQLAKTAEIANSTASEWLAHIMGLGIPRDRLCTEGKRPRYTQLCADLFASLGTSRKSGYSFEDWIEQAREDFCEELAFRDEDDLSISTEILVETTSALVPVGDRQSLLAELVEARDLTDLAMDILFEDVQGSEANALDEQIEDHLIVLDELSRIQREENLRAQTREKWKARQRNTTKTKLATETERLKGGKNGVSKE